MTLNEPDLLQQLMRTIDFTPDDLALNRTGIVSDHQVQLLKRMAWGETVLLAVVGLALAGVAVLVATGRIASRDMLSRNVCILGSAALTVLLAAVAGFSLRGRLAEAATLQGGVAQSQGKVLTVEGEGRKGIGGSVKSRHHYCQIGDLRFEIPFTAFKVFADGLTYRAYYTPSSKRLLSIEPKTPQPT